MKSQARPDRNSEINMRSDANSAVATISSHSLLGGRDSVEIVLGGQIYTLRLTRNARLQLTK